MKISIQRYCLVVAALMLACTVLVAVLVKRSCIANYIYHNLPATSSTDLVSADREVALTILQLPDWHYRPGMSASDLSLYLHAAKELQSLPVDDALGVLQECERLYINTPTQYEASSKIYVLLRFVFDYSLNLAGDQEKFFAVFSRVDAGAPAQNSLEWPLEWRNGCPTLVSGNPGMSGPPYSPVDEYAYQYSRFRYRNLPSSFTDCD